MSADRWFARCNDTLERIRTTQLDAIQRAAELVARTAEAGGGLHFYDTGHCSREAIHRAGGLCMMRELKFSLTVNSHPAPRRARQVSERDRATRDAAEEKLAALALDRSALAPGDLLLVSSVSGRSAALVELATAAQRMGVTVIAITNVTYSSEVPSRHSSGKRLFEVADLAIDNCGVVGDAALNVEGIDTGVAPTSGVAFCYIVWALVSEAVVRMLARGLEPHVYRSINLPDGDEFNRRSEVAYHETGL